LAAIQEVLQRFQVTATIFAHAGHGQLHIRPFLDLASTKDTSRLRALSEQIAGAVWAFDGLVGAMDYADAILAMIEEDARDPD
jgi:hypothetical protein